MGLLAVNVCIILIYRRNLNKEMKDEMAVNVTSAVNQYVALSQIPELNQTRTSASAESQEK